MPVPGVSRSVASSRITQSRFRRTVLLDRFASENATTARCGLRRSPFASCGTRKSRTPMHGFKSSRGSIPQRSSWQGSARADTPRPTITGPEKFAGRIVMDYSCADPTGIGGPSDVPVLTVVGSKVEHDYHAGWTNNDCGEYFSGRSGNSRSIVIKDGPHNITKFPETRDAIRRFIGSTNPH